MENKSNRIRNAIQRYTEVFGWYARDSTRFAKSKIIGILLASLLGIGFKFVAMYIFLLYIRLLEKNEEIILLGRGYVPRESLPILIIATITGLLLIFLSSVLIYLSKINSIRLEQKYFKYCGARVFKYFSKNLEYNSEKQHSEKTILRLARSDSRFCSRSLRLLLEGFNPVVTILVAGAIIFYINTVLTLILLSISLISLFFIYRINVSAAKSSAIMEMSSGGANQENLALIKQIKNKEIATEIEFDNRLEELYEGGIQKKFIDAYGERLAAPEKSVFITNMLMFFVFCIISVLLGYQVISGATSWSVLVQYLIFLRFSLSGFQQIIKIITSINRFYPQFRRYFLYVNNMLEPDFTDEDVNSSRPINSIIDEIE